MKKQLFDVTLTIKARVKNVGVPHSGDALKDEDCARALAIHQVKDMIGPEWGLDVQYVLVSKVEPLPFQVYEFGQHGGGPDEE